MRTKVAMFVLNNTQRDARVNREAETLARAGYEVRIYAFLEGEVPENEVVPCEGGASYRVSRMDQRSWLDRRWSSFWPRRRRATGESGSELRLGLPPRREPRTGAEPPPPTRELPLHASPEGRRHLYYIQRINQRWWEAARHWRPDICHAHDLDALWAAQSTALSCGSALVYDSHEIWDQQPFIRDEESVGYWNQWEARLTPSVDGWITVNRSLAEYIGGRYSCTAEMVVLHNAPKLTTPSAAARGQLKQRFEGRPVALFSGGFAPGRGLEQMVAAALLQKEVAVVIQGFGPLKPALVRLAEEHRSPVTFLDAVPRQQVVELVAGADIGVMPTLPDCLNSYYSTPNKIFDYLMAGLAVASGDIPEQRRLLEEWKNGILYDAWSPNDLAATLTRLAVDEVRLPMAAASRAAAEQVYNWERESAKLVDLYRQLVERKRQGRLRLKTWVEPRSRAQAETDAARSAH